MVERQTPEGLLGGDTTVVKIFLRLCLLFILTLLPSCGEGGGGSPTTPRSSSGSSSLTVSLTPHTASIFPNQVQAFSATAFDASGNPVAGATFVWNSSAPAVASIDTNGVAFGGAIGTAQITASIGGVTSAPSTLTVTQPVASIALSPQSATIAVNATQQFTATALDPQGNVIGGVAFSWASSSSAIATIFNGVATGVAPGTVLITASASAATSPVSFLTVRP